MADSLKRLVLIGLSAAALAACQRQDNNTSNTSPSSQQPIVETPEQNVAETEADKKADAEYDNEVRDNRKKVRNVLDHYRNITRRDVAFDGNLARKDEKTGQILCNGDVDPDSGGWGNSDDTTCATLSAKRTEMDQANINARIKYHIPKQYVIRYVDNKGKPQCYSSGEGETSDCLSMMAYDGFVKKEAACFGGAPKIEWSLSGNTAEAKADRPGGNEVTVYYDFDSDKMDFYSSDNSLAIKGDRLVAGGKVVAGMPTGHRVFSCRLPKLAPAVY